MSVQSSEWSAEFTPGLPSELHRAGAFAGDIGFISVKKPQTYEVEDDPGQAEIPDDVDPEVMVIRWRPVSIGRDGRLTRLAS